MEYVDAPVGGLAGNNVYAPGGELGPMMGLADVILDSGYRWGRTPLVWQERPEPVPPLPAGQHPPPGDGPTWDSIWRDLKRLRNALEQSSRGVELATNLNDTIMAYNTWREAQADPVRAPEPVEYVRMKDARRAFIKLMGPVVTAMYYMKERGIVPDYDLFRLVGSGKHHKVKKPKTLPDLWMEHPSLDPKLLKKLRRDRRIFHRWENSGHA